MRTWILSLVLLFGLFWLFQSRGMRARTEAFLPAVKSLENVTLKPNQDRPLEAPPDNSFSLNVEKSKSLRAQGQPAIRRGEPVTDEVAYVVEDGVAVVHHDIVIGVPSGVNSKGSVDIAKINFWESGEIPFHIQADLPQPERVIEAMAMFADTPIKFVPYEGQKDVLVFESGSGCRSYLGKVGGHQPVWISATCSSRDIAHEIMHAIGFIHEQNRSDRDQHVNIVWDNIQEPFRHNFEIFPSKLMSLSGLSPFDYESLMLYPPHAFAKNASEPTIISKIEGQRLLPGSSLSLADRQRLERFFQRR